MSETMEQMLEKMRAEIQEVVDTILKSFEDNNVTPKNSGYLAENIFIVDFKNKADFEKVTAVLNDDSKPEKVVRVVSYDKPKRIAIHF